MRRFVENQVRVGITKHEGINVSFGSVSTRVLNVFANLSCEKRGCRNSCLDCAISARATTGFARGALGRNASIARGL